MDELAFKFGDKVLRTSEYWWVDQDFYFRSASETYCVKGMYITDIKYEGLDYTFSEEVTIEPKIRYK